MIMLKREYFHCFFLLFFVFPSLLCCHVVFLASDVQVHLFSSCTILRNGLLSQSSYVDGIINGIFFAAFACFDVVFSGDVRLKLNHNWK